MGKNTVAYEGDRGAMIPSLFKDRLFHDSHDHLQSCEEDYSKIAKSLLQNKSEMHKKSKSDSCDVIPVSDLAAKILEIGIRELASVFHSPNHAVEKLKTERIHRANNSIYSSLTIGNSRYMKGRSSPKNKLFTLYPQVLDNKEQAKTSKETSPPKQILKIGSCNEFSVPPVSDRVVDTNESQQMVLRVLNTQSRKRVVNLSQAAKPALMD